MGKVATPQGRVLHQRAPRPTFPESIPQLCPSSFRQVEGGSSEADKGFRGTALSSGDSGKHYPLPPVKRCPGPWSRSSLGAHADLILTLFFLLPRVCSHRNLSLLHFPFSPALMGQVQELMEANMAGVGQRSQQAVLFRFHQAQGIRLLTESLKDHRR